MKKVLLKLEQVARNPVLRPIEVWGLRALLAFVAVKLGVDVKDLAQ